MEVVPLDPLLECVPLRRLFVLNRSAELTCGKSGRWGVFSPSPAASPEARNGDSDGSNESTSAQHSPTFITGQRGPPSSNANIHKWATAVRYASRFSITPSNSMAPLTEEPESLDDLEADVTDVTTVESENVSIADHMASPSVALPGGGVLGGGLVGTARASSRFQSSTYACSPYGAHCLL